MAKASKATGKAARAVRRISRLIEFDRVLTAYKADSKYQVYLELTYAPETTACEYDVAKYSIWLCTADSDDMLYDMAKRMESRLVINGKDVTGMWQLHLRLCG